jgi:Skp family chaperone for outer membrane proteins
VKSFNIAFGVLILSLVAITASAQQPPVAPRPQAPKPTAPAPGRKIAVINTALFQSEVLEFKAKAEQLNRQFEPRVKDVQGLADKINALETTLKTQGSVLNAATTAEKTEQLETMKKDYQRKAEDLQADAGKARDQAFAPISQKLGKFAEDYTAKRNIVLLIDIANGVQSGAVLWFDPRTDITRDFIAEYNRANPVPTAPAAAPAKPGQR